MSVGQTEASVYIVIGGQGEYSDYREWPVRAFRDEKAARELAEQLSATTRQLYQRYRAAEWGTPERAAAQAEVERLDPKLDFDSYCDPVDYQVWKVALDV